MTVNASLRLSVAMATYNGANFLKQQLDSLSSQTRLPDELIVTDDGSTDVTVDLIETFARIAPFPVKLYRNPSRLGFGDNFMSAVSRCSGDYIAFCDQDDVWLPEKLSVAVSTIGSTGADMFVHRAKTIDASGNFIGTHEHQRKEGLYRSNDLPVWGLFYGFTSVVRKDLLNLIEADRRPPDDIKIDLRLSHDRWAYFLANTFGSTYVSTAELVLYRQHSSNLYGSKSDSSSIKLRRFFTKYPQYLEKRARVSSSRAAVLEASIPWLQREVHRHRASKGVQVWREQEMIFRLRLEVLRGNRFSQRAKAVAELYRMRAFFVRGHGFDREGAAMTAMAFLLLIHRRRRVTR